MRVFHYCPSITPRDAIGYSTTRLHRALLMVGVESYLVCDPSSHKLAPPGTLVVDDMVEMFPTKNDLIIFHYSFADQNCDRIMMCRARFILVYHNITPGHFFRDRGMHGLADACDMGRAVLPQVVDRADLCIGDSDYNRSEFGEGKAKRETTIPVFFNDRFFRPSGCDHERFLNTASKPAINLTFIGRLVPNKRIDNVIRVAGAIKRMGFNPSLRIFGKVWDRDYFHYLEQVVMDLDLEPNVRFEVNQPGAELRASLAASDAFVTMSEHEGFMVPLLEAFTAGCPVIGLQSTAVTETCGPAGLLLPTPDIEAVAGLAVEVKQDRGTRMAVIRSQSRRAQAFAEGRTWNKWHSVLEEFVPQLRNA